MRCPSCGRNRPGWNDPCPTCGAEPGAGLERLRSMGLRQCAGCAYRGESVPYFRRPLHVGALLVLGLLTYGLGALVYWLVKRDARICPSCGVEWGPAERGRVEHALPAGDAASAPPAPRGAREGAGRSSGGGLSPEGDAGPGPEPRGLPADGGVRRVAGVVLVSLAGLVTVVGWLETGGSPAGWLVAPGVLGGVGGLLVWWGRAARRERRRALLSHLEQRALWLARDRGGELTASEVATALGVSLPAAERVLLSMDDGLRVRSDVTDDGILLFEFPEFRTRELPSRGAGNYRGT